MRLVWIALGVLVVIGGLTVLLNVRARRAGYDIPGKTPVRCSKGHLFLTTWVMGGSFTKVRLNPMLRWGRCPVGPHWATLRPVREADLTDEERHSLHGEQAGR